jgi:large subunit ribosomal protein L4
MAKLKVVTQAGKASGTVTLPDAVFGREPNPGLLHEVITRQQATWRQGTHATKTRGLVSGGGRKPWRQKGTGRARAGSNRSPLWRHGGTIQGPQPRDHGWRMPRKKVQAALHVALSDALREGKIACVKELKLKAPRTSEFVTVLKALDATGITLVIVDELTDALALASRNVPKAAVIEATDLTPYDVLAAERLVFVQPALAHFGETKGETAEAGEAAGESGDDTEGAADAA